MSRASDRSAGRAVLRRQLHLLEYLPDRQESGDVRVEVMPRAGDDLMRDDV